ncbi:MAG: hypothetical protein IPH95_00010 [Candidatus Promineofilum sp.]|nr:hypothetical protein [Promineifilum sp.]
MLIIGAGEVGQRVGQMINEYEPMGLNLSGYLGEAPSGTSEDGAHGSRARPGSRMCVRSRNQAASMMS